jgi:hypothetical protein
MTRIRKIQRGLLASAFVTLGMAVTVYADVMQGTGHLEKSSFACTGPFFIEGTNGGFIVSGDTSPTAGHWTVLASGDCRFETSVTIVDITNTALNQFVSVSANPTLFPGCFKLCVATNNKKIDYNMLMDSGPF